MFASSPLQVKEWDQRRQGMDIAVRHLLQRHLPDWVRPGQNGAAAAAAATAPAAPAAAAAVEAPAAAAPAPAAVGAAEPAAKQQVTGVKRTSTDGADATEQGAAKRQQTAAGPAAAAAGQGSSGTPDRSASDLQVQDLQRPADGQQQEVVAGASRVGCLDFSIPVDGLP